jgi:hypothetical protein
MKGGSKYLNEFFEMTSRLTSGREIASLYESLQSYNHHEDGSYNIRGTPLQIPELETDLVAILEAIDEQCSFLTMNGRIGVSTAPVREGDEIVLLTGESLPYIIRKSLHQPGRYTVISPCFLSNGQIHKSWLEWNWEGPTKESVESAYYKGWDYIELI